jgi:hypothetical protein
MTGFAFSFVACYPDFVFPDSLEQYRQARSLKFGDGHAPVMTWLWSKLNLIWEELQSRLLLQLGVLMLKAIRLRHL